MKEDLKSASSMATSPPLQAKQFFSCYDLLKHCSNTGSGFSATLFGEKENKLIVKLKKKAIQVNMAISIIF